MPMVANRPKREEKSATEIPFKTLKQWLRDMLLVREFEVRTMQAYQNRKIGGFCHVYIGQEAVAVGTTAAVRPDDPIITAYRCHGAVLARGSNPKYCMAELFGKIGGCAKGKGGSMHLFDKSRHFYGGHGIVGAQCPVGVGLAFATKYQDEIVDGGKSDKVTLCLFGDGALNQGSFHEAMNLAGILNLPIIFICENNGYAMGTSVARGTTMGHQLIAKATAFGIESKVVDGMDVLAVYNDMKSVADDCRKNSRPFFVEIRTYRYKGHSMSDPRKYRTKEEEKQYQDLDPIERLKVQLQADHDFSDDAYQAMNNDVKKEVRDAIKWAEESPEPDVSELYTDVYVEEWGPYTGTYPPQILTDNEK